MNQVNTSIRLIEAKDTYTVRQPVLRPGRPATECQFSGDEEESTLHLGYFINDEIVGVASFMKNSHPNFTAPVQYQLRGMAVLPNARNKKTGESLLLKGEQLLKEQQNEMLLWFNARLTAVDFYKKYSYTTTGEPFDVPNVCMHIVMHKEL